MYLKKNYRGVINIAEFRRAFFYFWVFGLISVLLDLDHTIAVYQNGMELNLENIAYHGTRTLHIPILIFSGCICIVTAALLLRFLHLNPIPGTSISIDKQIDPKPNPPIPSASKSNMIVSLLASSLLSSTKRLNKGKLVVIECPKCNHHMAFKPEKGLLEFPCPYCGVEGFIQIR